MVGLERACAFSLRRWIVEGVLDFARRTRNSSRAISNICSFKLLLSQHIRPFPSYSIIPYQSLTIPSHHHLRLSGMMWACCGLDIFKKSESMAELPDDLNFGVNMQGTAPNVPPPRPVEPPPKTTDESAAANSDRFDLKRAGHPIACIATFGFKAAGIFFYLLVGSFISNISTFIIVIILSSLDFWVVKNVTGRLLVGLRWWSEIDKNGKEQWRFENPSEGRVVNPVDNAFFWFSQVVGTLVWGILFVLKVLTLGVFWALLLFVCTSLCGTNLYAYYQCRGDHQKKLGELKKKGMMQFIGKAFG